MLPMEKPEGGSILQLMQEFGEKKGISLESLKLRSGIRLKLQGLLQNGPSIEVSFFAIVNKRRVLLGLPGGACSDSHLEIGEKCLVRGFDGSHGFSFESNVLELRDSPFVQVHLKYPDTIKYPGL